jgi:hypothetical protein
MYIHKCICTDIFEHTCTTGTATLTISDSLLSVFLLHPFIPSLNGMILQDDLLSLSPPGKMVKHLGPSTTAGLLVVLAQGFSCLEKKQFMAAHQMRASDLDGS